MDANNLARWSARRSAGAPVALETQHKTPGSSRRPSRRKNETEWEAVFALTELKGSSSHEAESQKGDSANRLTRKSCLPLPEAEGVESSGLRNPPERKRRARMKKAEEVAGVETGAALQVPLSFQISCGTTAVSEGMSTGNHKHRGPKLLRLPPLLQVDLPCSTRLDDGEAVLPCSSPSVPMPSHAQAGEMVPGFDADSSAPASAAASAPASPSLLHVTELEHSATEDSDSSHLPIVQAAVIRGKSNTQAMAGRYGEQKRRGLPSKVPTPLGVAATSVMPAPESQRPDTFQVQKQAYGWRGGQGEAELRRRPAGRRGAEHEPGDPASPSRSGLTSDGDDLTDKPNSPATPATVGARGRVQQEGTDGRVLCKRKLLNTLEESEQLSGIPRQGRLKRQSALLKLPAVAAASQAPCVSTVGTVSTVPQEVASGTVAPEGDRSLVDIARVLQALEVQKARMELGGCAELKVLVERWQALVRLLLEQVQQTGRVSGSTAGSREYAELTSCLEGFIGQLMRQRQQQQLPVSPPPPGQQQMLQQQQQQVKHQQPQPVLHRAPHGVSSCSVQQQEQQQLHHYQPNLSLESMTPQPSGYDSAQQSKAQPPTQSHPFLGNVANLPSQPHWQRQSASGYSAGAQSQNLSAHQPRSWLQPSLEPGHCHVAEEQQPRHQGCPSAVQAPAPGPRASSTWSPTARFEAAQQVGVPVRQGHAVMRLGGAQAASGPAQRVAVWQPQGPSQPHAAPPPSQPLHQAPTQPPLQPQLQTQGYVASLHSLSGMPRGSAGPTSGAPGPAFGRAHEGGGKEAAEAGPCAGGPSFAAGNPLGRGPGWGRVLGECGEATQTLGASNVGSAPVSLPLTTALSALKKIAEDAEMATVLLRQKGVDGRSLFLHYQQQRRQQEQQQHTNDTNLHQQQQVQQQLPEAQQFMQPQQQLCQSQETQQQQQRYKEQPGKAMPDLDLHL